MTKNSVRVYAVVKFIYVILLGAERIVVDVNIVVVLCLVIYIMR